MKQELATGQTGIELAGWYEGRRLAFARRAYAKIERKEAPGDSRQPDWSRLRRTRCCWLSHSNSRNRVCRRVHPGVSLFVALNVKHYFARVAELKGKSLLGFNEAFAE